MSHSYTDQMILELELCCRSLGQRILLTRELQNIRHLSPALGGNQEDDLPPVWVQAVQRHLGELPELEQRFYKACDEHHRLQLAATSPEQGEDPKLSLRKLIPPGP